MVSQAVLLALGWLCGAEALSPVGAAIWRRLSGPDFAPQRNRTWGLAGAVFGPGWLHATPTNQLGRTTAALPVAVPCQTGPDCHADFGLLKCSRAADCRPAYPGGTVPACRQSAAAGGAGLCVGHSFGMVEAVYEVVAGARRRLDISSLSAPDGQFLAAIRNGMTALHRKRQRIDVRMTFGLSSSVPKTDIEGYLVGLRDGLLRDVLGSGEGCLLRVSMAVWEENYLKLHDLSWNHAKIIAADGSRLFTGGHNLYTLDYLASSPVLDMSVDVSGSVAVDAHRFLDQQWRYICAEPKRGWINGRWAVHFPATSDPSLCPANPFWPESQVPGPEAPGEVPVFTLGRLGVIGNVTSDLAIEAMFGAANHSIGLALQDLGPVLDEHVPFDWWLFGHRWVMVALCKALLRGVQISIVQSGLKAMDSYGVGWSPADIAAMAMWYLNNGEQYDIQHNLTHAQIQALVCANFAVTTAHYTAEETEWAPEARCPAQWKIGDSKDCNSSGSKTFGVHTKFWFVDQLAFYVGSQNLYPNNLAEWGLIVDDSKLTAAVKHEFWDILWNASKGYAPTGPGSNLTECVASISIPTFPKMSVDLVHLAHN